VHQTKDLHTADYTQLYDFLKYNQKEVDELKAKQLAKIQDPLALMANSNNPYASPAPHQDQSSFNQNFLQQPITNPEDITNPTTAMHMALALMAKAFKLNYSTPTNNNQRISSNPRNRQIAQPGMNMGQDIQMQMIGGNGENQIRQYVGQNAGNLNGYNEVQDVGNQVAQNLRVQNIAFKLNYSTPTNNNQRISSNTRNRQIAQPGMNLGQDKQIQMIGGNGGTQFRQYAGNLNGYNDVQNVGNQVAQNPRVQNVGTQNGQYAGQNARNLNGYNEVQNVENHVAQNPRVQNVAGQNVNQIRCYNCRGLGHYARNCTARPRRRDAAYLQTQLLIAQKEAPVYDSDGSAEVHENDDNDEIFNMFTQEEQYTELLEPIPEPQQVPQTNNDVISEVTDVEQDGETVEQHSANIEETRALYESLYQNLVVEVEKVNSVNRFT
nr:hypothetical protein [Tanacetum cinerariifolium]